VRGCAHVRCDDDDDGDGGGGRGGGCRCRQAGFWKAKEARGEPWGSAVRPRKHDARQTGRQGWGHRHGAWAWGVSHAVCERVLGRGEGSPRAVAERPSGRQRRQSGVTGRSLWENGVGRCGGCGAGPGRSERAANQRRARDRSGGRDAPPVAGSPWLVLARPNAPGRAPLGARGPLGSPRAALLLAAARLRLSHPAWAVHAAAAPALALTATPARPSYHDAVGARDRGGDADAWRAPVRRPPLSSLFS